MHPTQRPIRRALAAGALSLALLSAGTAGAFAAEAKPTPSPTVSTAASITVKADKTSVKAGDKVTFTGRTKGLKVGSTLVLQHQNGSKWTALKATTTVKKGSSYSLTAKIDTKGTEHLRIAAGMVYSPTVTIKVS